MTEFEEFLTCFYHAQLKWKAIQTNQSPGEWNSDIQNGITALSNLSPFNYELEAHIIASKEYFTEITLTSILENVGTCLKTQAKGSNMNAFTMCLFNRLNIHHTQNK